MLLFLVFFLFFTYFDEKQFMNVMGTWEDIKSNIVHVFQAIDQMNLDISQLNECHTNGSFVFFSFVNEIDRTQRQYTHWLTWSSHDTWHKPNPNSNEEQTMKRTTNLRKFAHNLNDILHAVPSSKEALSHASRLGNIIRVHCTPRATKDFFYFCTRFDFFVCKFFYTLRMLIIFISILVTYIPIHWWNDEIRKKSKKKTVTHWKMDGNKH